ncbi:WhiB family transcriptional regulator [Streptosporangium amethystogenes subsp. fukuiense]|uniref:Transcriptional regulator WhiB n=1 Tax=Streptosporangium amethystogenes subsp. fukuiense TaxID=698418 RepID=A0ABW2T4V2_9ACTN
MSAKAGVHRGARRTPHHDVDWKRNGACRDDDFSTFFGPEGERPTARQAREDAAKEICGLCPVVEACLAYAMKHDEKAGVWGGLGEDERKDERRRRMRRAAAHAAGETS